MMWYPPCPLRINATKPEDPDMLQGFLSYKMKYAGKNRFIDFCKEHIRFTGNWQDFIFRRDFLEEFWRYVGWRWKSPAAIGMHLAAGGVKATRLGKDHGQEYGYTGICFVDGRGRKYCPQKKPRKEPKMKGKWMTMSLGAARRERTARRGQAKTVTSEEKTGEEEKEEIMKKGEEGMVKELREERMTRRDQNKTMMSAKGTGKGEREKKMKKSTDEMVIENEKKMVKEDEREARTKSKMETAEDRKTSKEEKPKSKCKSYPSSSASFRFNPSTPDEKGKENRSSKPNPTNPPTSYSYNPSTPQSSIPGPILTPDYTPQISYNMDGLLLHDPRAFMYAGMHHWSPMAPVYPVASSGSLSPHGQHISPSGAARSYQCLPAPVPYPCVSPLPYPRGSVLPSPLPYPSVSPPPYPCGSVLPSPLPYPSVSPPPYPCGSVLHSPVPYPCVSPLSSPVPFPKPSVAFLPPPPDLQIDLLGELDIKEEDIPLD